MATLGSVVVEMSASTAKFESDLGRASAMAERHMAQIDKAVDMVKSSIKTLGVTLGVGLALDQVKSKIEGAIQAAAGLQQLSERTGATVESLSGLASVAKLSGTDMDSLATGLQKLSKATVDAQNGGNQTSGAFKALGISLESLKGKGPEEVFKTIALQMDQYRDGVEKTTIAQALMGKGGANLLPVMKDLAVVGEYQVKTTTAQAEAADALEKNQIRLAASSSAIYKIIAMELVPVMNDFVMALIQVQNSQDGLKKSVQQLASEGKIRQWAQDAAIAVGTVVEALLGLVKVVSAVVGSFQVVIAESKVAIEFLKHPIDSMTGNNEGLKKTLDERAKLLVDVNKRYAALLEDGTSITTALRKQFDSANKQEGTGEAKKPKKDLDASLLGNNNLLKDDPYKKILDGKLRALDDYIAAENRLLKTRSQYLDHYQGLELLTVRDTETRKLELIVENREKVQKAYDDEIKIADDAMRRRGATQLQIADAENRRNEAMRKKAAAEIESNKEITDSMMRLAAVQQRFDVGTREKLHQDELANSNALFQISLMGKTTLEVMKLSAARQIDLDLQERIRQLRKLDPNADTSQAVANAAMQTAKATSLIETAYRKQREATFGASEAFRKYQEDAENAAAHVESAMTHAFQGMEDALVKFVMTGKLSFTDLANSIVADITRIIVKQMIASSIGGGAGGGAGWATSLAGSALGMVFGTAGTAAVASSMGGNSLDNMMTLTKGFGTVPGRAAGGPVDAGGLYQVNERGPEMLSVGGKEYLMMGGQAGSVTSNSSGARTPPIVINNHFATGTDLRTIDQAATQIGQRVQRAMARSY